MHPFTAQFAKFCESNLLLKTGVTYGYRSLSVCILDCVYSLRAKYTSVTIPVVERYAKMYMDGNRFAYGDTISALLAHIDEVGGPAAFADNVLKNHQKSGGKKAVPKEETCAQLAQYLKGLHIETIEDFQAFEPQELLEIVVHAVKGLGDAGTNYLFMLAGDHDRCKPDVHIHHCIRDACGEDVTNEECQILFAEAVEILQQNHPSLTVRDLDHTVWHKYQAES